VFRAPKNLPEQVITEKAQDDQEKHPQQECDQRSIFHMLFILSTIFSVLPKIYL